MRRPWLALARKATGLDYGLVHLQSSFAQLSVVILGLDPRIYTGCSGIDLECAALGLDPRDKPEDDDREVE